MAAAKAAADGTAVTVRGQVTKLLYKSNKTDLAFVWLADETGGLAIYVQGQAYDVAEGNTVTARGTYSLYSGTPELANAEILANDGKVSEPDSSWIAPATVADIIDLEADYIPAGNLYKVPVIPTAGNYGAYYLGDLAGTSSLLA